MHLHSLRCRFYLIEEERPVRLRALSKTVNIKVPLVFLKVLRKRSFGFRVKTKLMKSVFIAFGVDLWRASVVWASYTTLERVSVTSLEETSHSALDFPDCIQLQPHETFVANSEINIHTKYWQFLPFGGKSRALTKSTRLPPMDFFQIYILNV